MVILVALFVEKERYDEALLAIKKKFKIQNDKLFILEQEGDDEELIFTFNIEIEDGKREDLSLGDFGKLIRIHRKKETNTLYTINALNSIISSEKSDWESYRYSFLTVSSGNLKAIKTHLKTVADLNEVVE